MEIRFRDEINVPTTLRSAIELVSPELKRHFKKSENDCAEIIVFESSHELKSVIPDYEKIARHSSTFEKLTSFVYYDNFPNLVLVWENIHKKYVLKNNLETLLFHDIGHLFSWNEEKNEKAFEFISSNFLYGSDNNIVSGISEIFANWISDEGVIGRCYDKGLLNIRNYSLKNHLKPFYYGPDIISSVSLIASFMVLEAISKKPYIKDGATFSLNKLKNSVQNGMQTSAIMKYKSTLQFVEFAFASRSYKNIY